MDFESNCESHEIFSRIREIENGIFYEKISPPKDLEDSRMIRYREDKIVIGTPEQDVKLWHKQQNWNSCAVVCQEYVAESLLGENFSEERMLKYAREQGIYRDEIGTYQEDVGKLLEAMGLEVYRETGGTEKDLREVLEQDGAILVGVNSAALNQPMLLRFAID